MQQAYLQATSSAASFMELGMPSAARWPLNSAALALALAGIGDKALETLAEIDAMNLPIDCEYEVEITQARAWASAAAGDLGAARQHLESAVQFGLDVGDLLGATRALHGLARMDRAAQAAEVVNGIAQQVDGDMAAASVAYIRAAAARDPRALELAASGFEVLGANLSAAEALVEAAVTFRKDGHVREGTAAQHKAARLLARCEGAVTPFVRSVDARAQLTPAELDTALQAAAGSTDKQIAELMHLSVRTVENRLHRCYQKLGISQRRELPDALRDLPQG